MKTKEEQNARKEEVETVSEKHTELNEEELEKVSGGGQMPIGPVKSGLDFTSNNLTTSSDNLRAAESSYRDADMAKEMAEFTKNNILTQAAQSMRSQANQKSQGVLSLLQ